MARPQTEDPAASLRQLLTDLEAMDAGELRSAWLENEEQVRATLRGLDGKAPATAEALSRRWVSLCGRVVSQIDTTSAARGG